MDRHFRICLFYLTTFGSVARLCAAINKEASEIWSPIQCQENMKMDQNLYDQMIHVCNSIHTNESEFTRKYYDYLAIENLLDPPTVDGVFNFLRSLQDHESPLYISHEFVESCYRVSECRQYLYDFVVSQMHITEQVTRSDKYPYCYVNHYIGNYVRLTFALQYLYRIRDDCPRVISIVALEKFYIDIAVDTSMEVHYMSVVAPVWEVVDNYYQKRFDLLIQTDFRKNGGHFFGVYDTIIGSEKLVIHANGWDNFDMSFPGIPYGGDSGSVYLVSTNSNADIEIEACPGSGTICGRLGNSDYHPLHGILSYKEHFVKSKCISSRSANFLERLASFSEGMQFAARIQQTVGNPVNEQKCYQKLYCNDIKPVYNNFGGNYQLVTDPDNDDFRNYLEALGYSEYNRNEARDSKKINFDFYEHRNYFFFDIWSNVTEARLLLVFNSDQWFKMPLGNVGDAYSRIIIDKDEKSIKQVIEVTGFDATNHAIFFDGGFNVTLRAKDITAFLIFARR